MTIEVEVHSSLRAFLREQKDEPIWPHHLTMARLVARALRLGRSALIQTGVPLGQIGNRYRLSYLAPALIWAGPVIVVATVSVQQQLLESEIPQLQKWLQKSKAIQVGNGWTEDFQGLLLIDPASWLAARFQEELLPGSGIPTDVPTIIDGADDLEEWARDQLTACIRPADWDELMLMLPDERDAIREARVHLAKAVFQHPANPYECCLIEAAERDILRDLYQRISVGHGALSIDHGEDNSQYSMPHSLGPGLPPVWRNFWYRWQTDGQMMWASIQRTSGLFSLYCGPVEVATELSKVWPQQPVVLIGSVLDLDAQASVYRQQMGLGNLTCLQFSPDRQSELIQLYLPDRLPMPNTPQFQDVLIQQIRSMLSIALGYHPPYSVMRPVALLIGDTPLKAQVGAVLAAEFGSRVQVEKTSIDNTSILISGWEFWRRHQSSLPAPSLLVIATLPIPSLENPLVAGRVAYYKQQHKDWFRLYLLPIALRELQRAIAPVRSCQGVVALLDNRVNHRSYGQQVLAALSPLARLSYLDSSWFADLS